MVIFPHKGKSQKKILENLSKYENVETEDALTRNLITTNHNKNRNIRMFNTNTDQLR